MGLIKREIKDVFKDADTFGSILANLPSQIEKAVKELFEKGFLPNGLLDCYADNDLFLSEISIYLSDHHQNLCKLLLS